MGSPPFLVVLLLLALWAAESGAFVPPPALAPAGRGRVQEGTATARMMVYVPPPSETTTTTTPTATPTAAPSPASSPSFSPSSSSSGPGFLDAWSLLLKEIRPPPPPPGAHRRFTELVRTDRRGRKRRLATAALDAELRELIPRLWLTLSPHLKYLSEDEVNTVRLALEVSALAHHGQRRKVSIARRRNACLLAWGSVCLSVGLFGACHQKYKCLPSD